MKQTFVIFTQSVAFLTSCISQIKTIGEIRLRHTTDFLNMYKNETTILNSVYKMSNSSFPKTS